MKTCQLHPEARPAICHDCARDEKLISQSREPARGPMRILESDRGKMRIEVGTGRGNPTKVHWDPR